MTSKISFSKLVRIEMKQLAWLTALQSVIFGLLIPFRVMMRMSVAAANEAMGQAVDRLQVLCSQIGLNRWENTVLILLLGTVCALCGFHYLHSQGKLDFYHSLPIKRDRLFAAKYLASTLTFVFPYAAAQLLALVTGAVYGAFSVTVVAEMVICTVQNILFFLCSYAAGLMAVILTGKLLTTILAIGVFGCYVPMLLMLILYFKEVFLASVRMGIPSYALRMLVSYSSPWAFCMMGGNSGRNGMTGRWPDAADLCQLVAVAALISLAALALYRRRQTEAAGRALAFRRLEGMIKMMLAVPVSLGAAIIADGIFGTAVWSGIFILLFGTLFCVLVEFIYRWDIRQALMHKWHIAFSVLLAMAVFFGFRYDVMGYNTYLPKPEELAAISVKSSYISWEIRTEDGRQLSDGSVYDEIGLLDYLESDRVDLLYPVAQSGVANQKAQNDSDAYPDNVTWVDVKYRLKSGKQVYRSYLADVDIYVRSMNELFKDEAYRERMYPILTWNAENVVRLQCSIALPEGLAASWEAAEKTESDTEISDSYASRYAVEVPADRFKEVLEAYQKELRELPADEILNAGHVIEFQSRMQEGSSWKMDCYPYSEAFENTTKLLLDIAKSSSDFPKTDQG